MSVRRVLRWDVPADDEPHKIGGGPVVMVHCRPDVDAIGRRIEHGAVMARVEVWTEELVPDEWPGAGEALVPKRTVQVFGTGYSLPEAAVEHLGGALDGGGRLVWHVYSMFEVSA